MPEVCLGTVFFLSLEKAYRSPYRQPTGHLTGSLTGPLTGPLTGGPELRDTARLSQRYPPPPPYCALWGFWCLNMANWVRYPFSERYPGWRAYQVEMRYPSGSPQEKRRNFLKQAAHETWSGKCLNIPVNSRMHLPDRACPMACHQSHPRRNALYICEVLTLQKRPLVHNWDECFHFHALSGNPLNWLNAILSLLQPLDGFRSPLFDRERDWKALSRPMSHPRTGRSPQPPCSKPLRGAQPGR